MIKHIVMWTLKERAEGATKRENALRVKALLEACAGQTPGLRRLDVGVDLALDDGAWDIALCAEFDDRRALDAYQEHPVHQAAKFFIAKVRDQRAVVDYEASPSPPRREPSSGA